MFDFLGAQETNGITRDLWRSILGIVLRNTCICVVAAADKSMRNIHMLYMFLYYNNWYEHPKYS